MMNTGYNFRAHAILETTDTAASLTHFVVLLHGRLREGEFWSRKLTDPCVISSGQQVVAVSRLHL